TPYIGATAQSARTFNSTATTEIVTGLTNATTYSFKIAATNANGTGPQSFATNQITVAAPLSPTGPSAVPGNAQATVSWTAPANNALHVALPIFTPYIGATAQSARTFNSTATTEIVTGLTNATTYSFKIAATNANGT